MNYFLNTKTFKDVKAWQKAYELTLNPYQVTQNFPKSEQFGLTSQLRRASVSIVSNLAEGYKRKGSKEKLRFYNIAEASLEEVKCQTMLARDLNYLDKESYKTIEILENKSGKLLSGWIKGIQKSTAHDAY